MSPTEQDLRRALHAGQGGPPDPDAVLGAARGAQRRRRGRLAAVTGSAVAVLAVAGIAVGVGLGGSGSGPSRAASAAAGGPTPAGPLTNSVPAGSMPPGPRSSAGGSAGGSAAASCPSSPPNLAAPGVRPGAGGANPDGGATSTTAGQLPGQSGALLPAGVTQITVCVYSSRLEQPAEVLLSGQVISGSSATTLVTELNALPQSSEQACSEIVGRTVALEARTASGGAALVVGDASGCGRVTNGTVTRIGGALVRSLVGGPGSGQGTAVPPLTGTPGAVITSGPPIHPSPGPGPS